MFRDDITDDQARAFVTEYRELCKKYHLVISATEGPERGQIDLSIEWLGNTFHQIDGDYSPIGDAYWKHGRVHDLFRE